MLSEANHRHYVQCRPLPGFHSLLPLEDVTLIAVPDAVQRGWKKEGAPPLAPLPAPVLDPVPLPHDRGAYALSWQEVKGATACTVQEATEATFAQPVTLSEGRETIGCVSDRPDCPRLYYYRVGALRGSEVSPWSNTEGAAIPSPDFEDCQATTLEAPELEPISLTSPVEDEYVLCWSSVDGATGYTLQEAVDLGLNVGTTFHTGSNTSFPVRRRCDGVYYYGVRRERNGEPSPWSNTQSYVSPSRQVWAVKPPEDYRSGDLLAVQRALLGFCAARGDLLALLSLPGGQRLTRMCGSLRSVALCARVRSSILSLAAAKSVLLFLAIERRVPKQEGRIANHIQRAWGYSMSCFVLRVGFEAAPRLPGNGFQVLSSARTLLTTHVAPFC